MGDGGMIALYMTPAALRAFRLALGWSEERMGLALGLGGWTTAATRFRYRRLEARGVRADVRDEGIRRRLERLKSKSDPINMDPT